MQKVIGIIAATGATMNIELGFDPDKVTVRNTTDRTEHVYLKEDTENAYGVAVGATGTKTSAGSAAAGVVAYDGAAGSAAKGFTIGASAVVNDSGDELVYEAEGGLLSP